MKKVLIVLSALAVVAACSTEPKDNTLTKAEKADGWELLFDGQTLNGWRNFNQPDLTGDAWVVEDGATLWWLLCGLPSSFRDSSGECH